MSMKKAVKTVVVQFRRDVDGISYDGRKYSYLWNGSVEVGQDAIVDVAGTQKIVRVVGVHEGRQAIATKWLVCVIDKTTYDQRIANGQALVDARVELEKYVQQKLAHEKLQRILEDDVAGTALLNKVIELEQLVEG